MPGRIPSIREFPDDGRDWRIEGLGAVERSAHELTIEVCLTPHSVRELVAESSSISERRQVSIGIGQLPYLSIGSHWRNKQLQSRTTGIRHILKDVAVRDDTTQLVRLGHSFGPIPGKARGQLWLVPPFKYPFPKALYDSQCIAIAHDGDPHGIILPVAEAIRFYYAPSTDLAHVMFGGGHSSRICGM